MATPTSNSVPVTYIDPAATGIGRYVADGEKWGGGLGSGVTLTYSFPRDPNSGWHSTGYGEGEWGNWLAISDGERAAVRKALAAWSSVANLGFTEVSDNNSTVGELRFAYTKVISPEAAAHAYLPSLILRPATFGSAGTTSTRAASRTLPSAATTSRRSCTRSATRLASSIPSRARTPFPPRRTTTSSRS